MARTFLFILAIALSSNAQLDTSALGDNTWVSIWTPGDALTVTGNNWAYENDWHAHPFYGFFVMGPGHYVHPQDCYYYPFDPLKKKWTKINSSRRVPRMCLSSFTINSQDTVILHMGGGEGSHQQGQGAWNGGLTSIDLGGKRGARMWAYSFNRNEWYHMKGPHPLPKPQYTQLQQYDPVHDLLIVSQSDSSWIYNFHSNTARGYRSPVSFTHYAYSCAVDRRRGLYYILYQGVMRCFNPETEAWSVIPGTQPPCPNPADGASGVGLNMMAYDDVNDVMIYTGDDNSFGLPRLKTWVFDCDSLKWTLLAPANAPQDRGRLAYSRPLNAFVTLGATAASAISRGGGTSGMWAYRYKRGPGVFAGRLPIPDASINTEGREPRLNWKSVAGATGYHVYRGLADPFAKGFVKITASPVTDTFYADAAAAASTPYVYKVCGVSGSVDGELSRLLYARPARVLGAVASVEDTDVVKVSWDANAAGTATYYNVYRAKGAAIFTAPFPGSGYAKVNAAPVYGTEFTDTSMALLGFRDGYARGYIVTAVNGLGLESGLSPECTTFPDSPEWTWVLQTSTPQGLKMAFRWQPPRRTKILGLNLYRIHESGVTTPDSMYRTICGGGGFWSGTYTYATRQNGTLTAPALITDSVTYWPMPPGITVPPGTDKVGYYMQGQTYIARAVNMFGQEGFCTDQISPNNVEYDRGLVVQNQRFNYAEWQNSVAAEQAPVGISVNTNGLTVHPNPGNPGFTLSFRAQQPGRAGVRVFNAAGRVVMALDLSVRPGLNSRHLLLNRLPAGIYAVQVSCDGRRMTQRAVLVR